MKFKKVAYFAPRYEQYVQPHASAPVSCYLFIADDYYDVVDIWAAWSVASTSGTVDIQVTPAGTALGSGTSVLASPNFATSGSNGTNTPIQLARKQPNPPQVPFPSLAKGQALAFVYAGTAGSQAGLVVEVVLRPSADVHSFIR